MGEGMRVILLAVAIVFMAQSALASKNFVSVSSRAEIDKTLSEIPARGRNLEIVLRHFGLKADSILLAEPDETDIASSSLSIRKGDRFIDINLREPLPAVTECQLFQPISFTLRGGKYLPQTTTANFLARGKCEAPGK